MVEQRSPKPRAEGSSPSAPAKNREASTMLASLFFLARIRTRQRGAPAGSPAVRVVGACSPVGCVQARPRRQPRQVLLPLPQNRRKHWVFAGFLFSCVALLSGAFWFGFLVSPPVRTGRTPLQHPKRTRFRPFWTISGAFCSFPLFFGRKIFALVFVQPAHSAYKLKPSVITCRREVSFFT